MPTEADLALAAEVIKAYRVAGNIFQAAQPITKSREALRQLADELEAQSQAERESAEDFDRGAAWGREDAADRLSVLLSGGAAVSSCLLCDGTGSLPDADHPCGNCGGSGEFEVIPISIRRKDA